MAKYRYKVADKSIVYHADDPKLDNITVVLPEPPSFEDTLGFGLSPDDQYWDNYQRLNPIPPKLAALKKQKISDYEKRKQLLDNEVYYSEEIDFIKQEWERSEQGGPGLWLFIKGKQYWMPPEMYFSLREWSIGDIHPRYYKRDWKYWVFSNFSDADPCSYGFNYVKFRREGATTKVSCWRYWRAMQNRNHKAGCQSKNDDHAEEVHTAFVMAPWKKLSFWFRPIWDNDTKNTSEINFLSPVAKNDPWFGEEALDSVIDYKDAGIFAYDGTKQHSFHNDEVGKMPVVDVNERWQVQRPCFEQGARIIGKARNTSTVAEMDKKGGRRFKILCDDSHYGKRNENGRTKSGLYNLFISATDGYEMSKADVAKTMAQLGMDPTTATDYPDKFGECDELVTHKYMTNTRQAFLDDGDIVKYIEECRQFPMRWDDCWMESSRSQNFNMLKIERRLAELSDDKYYYTHVKRGNFKWENDIRDSKVIFEESETGKFYVSFLFDQEGLANKHYYSNNMRHPGNTNKFHAGADPFKFKKTRTNKRSDGGGAVFMMRDGSVDHALLDISQWTTNRFCCTYSNRPKDKTEYGEDMLMMCVYYGCEMYPEINVEFIWEYFEERGYFAYLTFGVNRKTLKIENTPGGYSRGAAIEEIFREYHSYIENHCEREMHREILQQCKEIDDDMGDYDLFVAGGHAMVGIKKNAFNPTADQMKKWEEDDYFGLHDID